MLVAFLILSFVGLGAKTSASSVSAATTNPISISRVLVDDISANNTGYNQYADTDPTILDTKIEDITYDGTNIPFILLENSYSELSGDYTVYTDTSGIFQRVRYNGTDYTADPTTGYIEIPASSGTYYFYNSTTGQILKHEGQHEAVHMNFGTADTYYNDVSVTIKLNGSEIAKNNNVSNGSYQYFQQYFHGLTASLVASANFHTSFNTKLNDTAKTPLETVEGLYEIKVTYREASSTVKTANFSFYLVTSDTYANEEESVNFSYTQKHEYANDNTTATYAVEHYFNQTDENTTLADGTEVDTATLSALQFPTITFNPEKYQVSYKRVLYSYNETGTFSFATSAGNVNAGTLTLTVTRNGVTISTVSKALTRASSSDPFIAEWTFQDLGDYEFSKHCMIKTGENVYVVAQDGSISLTDTNLLKKEALYIGGFQAMYAKNGTSSDYLRNSSYNSDFTYLNNGTGETGNLIDEIKSKPSSVSDITLGTNTIAVNSSTYYISTSSTATGSTTYNINNTISTTNQAPVWLKYNATLNSTANTSWYVFVSKSGSTTTVTVNNYTYSTQFSQAGTYYVFLSFENKFNSNPIVYTQQLIAFKITNTQPTVTMQTTTATAGSSLVGSGNTFVEDENSVSLGVNDYTNKNVYIKWAQAGPFDANIYAVYTQVDYNNNDTVVKSNTSLNGLVYYSSGGTVYANNNATVLTQNGHYSVKIYYTNSTASSFVCTFTIDNSNISGIMALNVDKNSKQLSDLNTLSNNILSQLTTTGYNLVTNNPFVWTWNEKASGAAITAKWCYSSLTNVSEYNLPELIANGQSEQWVLANGEFGLLTTTANYIYKQVTSENYKTLTFSTSQILSTSRICILLLSDEAGNTATFVTILDNISPEFIQQEAGSSLSINSTIISKTTQITWGSHKALSIATDEDNTDFADLITEAKTDQSWTFNNTDYAISSNVLSALNAYFKLSSSSELYYTSLIDHANVTFTDGNSYNLAPTYANSAWTKTSVWVVVKKVDNSYYTYLSTDYTEQSSTPYGNMTQILLSDGQTMTSCELTISVYDKLNNTRTRTKQVSLDKSQGSMFSHSGTVDNTGTSNTTDMDLTTANRKQLFSNNSTNRDYATFSFLQQTWGIFQVKTITLQFYALEYNKDATNYPYSDTATTTVLYQQGSVVNTSVWYSFAGADGTYYHSYALKKTGTGISQAGMYVITRTYIEDFDNVSNQDLHEGDVNNLQYTFYVDRTKIISLDKNSNYITGSDIALKLGLTTYGSSYTEKVKTFNDFAKQTLVTNEYINNFTASQVNSTVSPSTPASPVLSSNILPSQIALKLINNISYKYKGTNSSNSVVYNTSNRNMTLMMVVQQFGSQGFVNQKLFTSAVTTSNTSTNIYPLSALSSATFNSIGTYRVMIMDTSNLTGTLTGSWSDLTLWEYSKFIPNYTIFSFHIKQVDPSATAVVHSASIANPYTTLGTSSNILSDQSSAYFTGNDNVILTFTDSTDNYLSKIAYNDLVLTQTLYYLNSSATMTRSNPSSITVSTPRTWNGNDLTAMGEIFSATEIERIQGTYTGDLITSLALSTKAQNNGILYYRELISGTTDRYKYYVLLPSVSEVNGYQADCLYSLSYHYLGNRETYKITTNNSDGTVTTSYSAYENTTLTYVDHTAPYKNLVALVNADTYLTTAQKNDILANINNPDYEFLQDYAFAVNPSFVLTSQGDSENGSVFYYKKYASGKYNGTTYQTAVPGSSAYDNNTSQNKFNESTFASKLYGSFPTDSGYYDIIEVDKSGNYRVYSVYLNSSAVQISATGTDATTTADTLNYYLLTAGFNGSYTPTYTVTENKNNTSVWTSLYNKTGEAVISAYSFTITGFTINDAWYTIKYRLQNGNSNANWNTITVTPDSDTSTIIETLNAYIAGNIASGALSAGCKMEFVINNRAGNDIRFFLHTAGLALSLNDLSPTKIGTSSFTIIMPVDTYSTQYSNFVVKVNGTTPVTKDSQNKNISDANTNRSQAQSFVFTLGTSTKYYFYFTDNFGKEYLFVYPTTSNLINEIVYAEGSTPQLYDGVMYTPNNTIFRYTSSSIEKIGITITDQTSGSILLSFSNLLYSNNSETSTTPKDLLTAAEMYSTYFTVSKTGTTVTVTFKAITNTNYVYVINFVDIDNNATTHTFGIYSYSPAVSLTDTSGVSIWSSSTANKVTSKTVVARWITDNSILFNPRVQIVYNSVTTVIDSPYTMTGEGSYVLQIVNDLGIINSRTVNFTIKPATIAVYGVYFNDTLLTAHTETYAYAKSATETLNVKQYFFLSNSVNAWSSIVILPNEDKELSYEQVATDGNTRIYRVFGSTYEIYFAVTQIYSSNNNLTTFGIYTYTSKTNPTSTSVISSGEYSLRLSPDAGGNATYAKLTWNTSYYDSSNSKSYSNFVYLYIVYNDTISMGNFTSGTINLTKSGKYTIQIHDIVGQTHRFGSTVTTNTFTLTLLNDIIFYVNSESPIENASYNDNVVLSLVDISNYNWSTTGSITVLRNNVEYTGYVTSGTTWTFTETGHYKITLSTTTATTSQTVIKGTLNFTIIDENESRLVFDFAKISGYTVESVKEIEYDDYTGSTTYTDITETLKTLNEATVLQNFTLSEDTVGAGRYLITINTKEQDLVPGQTYSFTVWINNETPTLYSSRDFGTSDTSAVTITYNPSLIYQKVGNSYIALNGTVMATIDASREEETTPSTFTFSTPGTYLVQVYSESGTLLSSQRITITVPLNTAAIILIVLGCVVALGIIITFIILRTRMKIK